MKRVISVLFLLINICLAFPVQAIIANNWHAVFSGYGSVDISKKRIVLNPKISSQENETHAALAIGPNLSKPVNYQLQLKTIKQSRQNSEPKAWEVGWVIWNYTDNDHFYYFICKPNGWELGKRDPVYDGGQRFLATGSDIKYQINKWHKIRIRQTKNNVIKVFVNGKKIVQFQDNEDPYQKGRVGVYSEDAYVKFRKIKIVSL